MSLVKIRPIEVYPRQFSVIEYITNYWSITLASDATFCRLASGGYVLVPFSGTICIGEENQACHALHQSTRLLSDRYILGTASVLGAARLPGIPFLEERTRPSQKACSHELSSISYEKHGLRGRTRKKTYETF